MNIKDFKLFRDKNYIDGEKAKIEMKSKDRPLGYHVLHLVGEKTALLELSSCCSSKRVKKIEMLR